MLIIENLKAKSFLRYFIINIFLIAILIILSCRGTSQDVGIIKGGEYVNKSIFYSSQMMAIRNLVQQNFDSTPDAELAVFDQQKMHIVDPKNRKVKNIVKFNRDIGVLRPTIIKPHETSKYYILSAENDFGLMDNFGNQLWQYNQDDENLRINSMVGDDLDSDGNLEFYAATNRGLHKLSFSGEKIWEKSGWIYDVKISKKNDGKPSMIVTVCHDGKIQYRNNNGILIRELKPQIKIYRIEIVDWPNYGNILASSGKNIIIIDSFGKVFLKHKLNYHIFSIRGTIIKIGKKGDPFLAVISNFGSSIAKTMLCVFSPKKELIYKELLYKTNGLLAFRDDVLGEECLLVGNGPGQVYKYSFNRR